jgi:CDGSH iron-sulfur domain-containing protein 3
MNRPTRASDSPFAEDVEEGKTYHWCACGQSQTQPFCDGSHAGTEFNPVKYISDATETVYFCGCRQTGSQPMCDGSHAKR